MSNIPFSIRTPLESLTDTINGLNNQLNPSIPLTVYSTAGVIPNGGAIPATFTPDGIDQSPPMFWTDSGSANIAEYAIVITDPDADNFVHWIYYNIPSTVKSVLQNETTYSQGVNSNDNNIYDGPAPPSGETHTYVFTVYALPTAITTLPAAATLLALGPALNNAVASGSFSAFYTGP